MRAAHRGAVVVTAAALMGLLSTPVAGQEVPLGAWSGSVSNPGSQNRGPQPASLDLKKVPDPHWRWRGGPRDVLTGIFVAGQAKFELSTIHFDGDTLAYAFTNDERDGRVQCELKRQMDGSYEGDCSGAGFRRHVLLRPPDNPPGPGETVLAR